MLDPTGGCPDQGQCYFLLSSSDTLRILLRRVAEASVGLRASLIEQSGSWRHGHQCSASSACIRRPSEKTGCTSCTRGRSEDSEGRAVPVAASAERGQR